MKAKLYLLFRGDKFLSQTAYLCKEDHEYDENNPYSEEDEDNIFTIEFDYYKEEKHWFRAGYASSEEFARSFSVGKLLINYLIDDDWSFVNN